MPIFPIWSVSVQYGFELAYFPSLTGIKSLLLFLKLKCSNDIIPRLNNRKEVKPVLHTWITLKEGTRAFSRSIRRTLHTISSSALVLAITFAKWAANNYKHIKLLLCPYCTSETPMLLPSLQSNLSYTSGSGWHPWRCLWVPAFTCFGTLSPITFTKTITSTLLLVSTSKLVWGPSKQVLQLFLRLWTADYNNVIIIVCCHVNSQCKFGVNIAALFGDPVTCNDALKNGSGEVTIVTIEGVTLAGR